MSTRRYRVAPMLDAAVDEKVVELAIESTKPNVPGEHEEDCGWVEDEDAMRLRRVRRGRRA
jgi:S-ribosylhomocysteine lyase LuxS involved in autoinducer biosynthesis